MPFHQIFYHDDMSRSDNCIKIIANCQGRKKPIYITLRIFTNYIQLDISV